jgi:hypothetical protein
MTRNSLKLTALAATALLGGVVGVNCSKGNKGDDTTGNIALALTLPNGYTINSVDYRIHAGMPSGITDVTGSINTSDPNSTASVAHSFPASTGDVVTLTAVTTGGINCTGTSSAFDLTAGGEAHVNVTVLCGSTDQTHPNQGNGTVFVNGTFTVQNGDICPLLTSWFASPLQTSVGGTISVGGSAIDGDAGETVAYSWTDGATQFATTANASYICGAAGAHTLTLTVTDNHSPTCSTSISIPVTCVAVGAGGSGGGAAGAAGGAAGAAGGAAGAAGSVAGAAGSVAGAAGGVAGAAGGVAGAAGGAAGAGGGAAGSPGTGQSAACLQCEITNTTGSVCFNTSSTANAGTTNPALFGCNGFSGADKTNCEALIACLNGATCQAQIATANATLAGDYPFNDDPLPCLCGTSISKATCLTSSSWSGACAPQFVAAAAGGNLLNLFTSTDSPVGVANNLMSCEIDSMPASGFGIGVPCAGASVCSVSGM